MKNLYLIGGTMGVGKTMVCMVNTGKTPVQISRKIREEGSRI